MAGNSTVKIYLQGDSAGISRAARDAERSLARLHGRASTAFRGMSEMAGGFGLAMGAAGVLGAVQQSVQAYQESEKSGARMAAQLDTLTKNTSLYRQQIDDAIKAQSEFGAFDDEDLQDSFTKLLRSTGDVSQALELNNLVMDIARGRGVDLATASDAVAKAAAGNTGALRRMGIQIEKGASAQEALAAAQDRYAGQAKTYGETNAAEADRAAIAWENAQEEFGQKAAQAFTVGAQGARKLADNLDDVVDAAGGLQGLAAGGGAFLAVQKLGPAALNAGQAVQTMRREIELTSRIKTGQLDVFNIANQKIDTRATQKNIRQAYRDIGQTISTAQASALAKGERIAAPIGRLGTIPGMARRAGASLVSLAGGPMGIAAVGAAGLALGIQKLAQEMTTVEEEARDSAQAIKELNNAQLDAQGAALDVEQAELNLDQARKQSRNALSQLHQAEAGMRRVRKQHLEDTPAGVAALQKYRQAVDNEKRAQLELEQAHHRVAIAKHNQQTADASLTASAANLSKQLRGQRDSISAAAEKFVGAKKWTHAYNYELEAGKEKAKRFADSLVQMTADQGEYTDQNRATAAEVANLVRQLDHFPSDQEIDWITNTIETGGDVDELKRKLGLVPAATDANVTSNAEDVINAMDRLTQAINGIPASKRVVVYYDEIRRDGERHGNAATGASIAGRFDGADNVPVNVSRGEVILNPTQIAMIGAQRVYGALRATGAPVIRAGGSYAGGGKAPTRAERWEKKLQRADDAYRLRFNQLDATLAAAEQTVPRDRNDDGTIDADEQRRAYRDDNVARRKIRALIQARLRQLRRYLRQNPTKAARERIYGEIATLTRDYQNYAELKPEEPVDTGTDGGADVDTSDLEARLAQAEARAAAAGRNLALSEAALSTFGGVGRGAGRASPVVVQQFHSIFPPTPDQYRQGAAFMADAFGRQTFRRSPRIRIGA